MRELFALSANTGLVINSQRLERKKKREKTYRHFETLLRPSTVLKTQVKEPDLAPNDCKTPKNDESFLDDVWAGEP